LLVTSRVPPAADSTLRSATRSIAVTPTFVGGNLGVYRLRGGSK